MNDNAPLALSDYDVGETTSGERWNIGDYDMRTRLPKIGWLLIRKAIRTTNCCNQENVIDCTEKLEETDEVNVRKMTLIKYYANQEAGIEAHRDEYAVFGTAIIVLKDSLGHSLQIHHCKLPNPLKPRDSVMVNPKSGRWVPVASRIADRVVIVIVF